MPQRKSDKPSVATFADHEVITPPNTLRKAMATVSEPADDPVARAEEALAQLSGEFSDWMHAECDRLDTARRAVSAAGLDRRTRDALFHAAHDIKGEAATFGFPSVAEVAESLCRLIEHTPDLARVPQSLIDQHVDAVRAIVRERAQSDAAETAAALAGRLREVTDDFLRRENAHRPDYLDGIVGPPLAPDESGF